MYMLAHQWPVQCLQCYCDMVLWLQVQDKPSISVKYLLQWHQSGVGQTASAKLQ